MRGRGDSSSMGRAGPALVVALGAIAAGFGAAWYLYESSPPLRSAGGPAAAGKGAAKESGGPKKRSSASTSSASMRVTIIYGTTTGTARNLAKNLQDKLNAAGAGSIQCRVVDMAAYDFEDLESEEVVIAIVSTYTGGEAPATAASFFRGLAESTTDFRVGKNSLSSTRYAVFGLGSSEYAEYCSAGRRLDTLLEELGGQQMLLMGEGDDVVGTDRSFAAWTLEITGLVTKGSEALVNSSVPSRATKGERRQGKRASPGTVPNGLGGGEEEPTEEDLINDQQLTDLEDLGAVMASSSSDAASAAREMITPLQRKSLQKEGYKLIGSHSAVKMCRWTKAQMRGRGGCYKHTMYGITSYQCMEMTPSLACANKCVFCWRHHKNPVGREWRWKVDPPLPIVEEGISRHQRMVKEMKGVPGVKPERLEEAMTVRHCALSLVGEPIMYPHISELLEELHRREISTFLVTNAQFPDAIKSLPPVTQLYVSIDAATKDSLKAVDRPLFKDFWERFISSLRALKNKGQRTVYRLTLVKGWNMQEVKSYVDLIDIGTPELIEIKGVTYCGTSAASSLTMENVPWHEEVVAFATAIAEATGGRYGLACEHKHSCCILLADKSKYLRDGRWHTWIDYPAFHALVKSGKPFTSAEYCAPTPEWAVFGAPEAGFDPVESRHYRNGKGKLEPVEYEASSSGCG